MELQRQLGLKKYDTAFRLMHKIRSVMGKRDSSYMLKGMVEYDEAYVEKAVDAKLKKQLKRGKGSQRQVIVAVAAESTLLSDPESGKAYRHCGFFKMKVIPRADAASVDGFVEENIEKKSLVTTDQNKAYVHLEKLVETHIKVKSSKNATNEELNWVHTAISNLKKNLLGIYHMVTEKYIQNYIDEFVYKLNRRYFGEKIFDRLIIAAVQTYV